MLTTKEDDCEECKKFKASVQEEFSVRKTVESFFRHKCISYYNEISLQFELGRFIQAKIPKLVLRYEIALQLPMKSLLSKDDKEKKNEGKNQQPKKRPDILIYQELEIKNPTPIPYCIIELKMPINGMQTDALQGFCRDILCLDALKKDQKTQEALFLGLIPNNNSGSLANYYKDGIKKKMGKMPLSIIDVENIINLYNGQNYRFEQCVLMDI